ncbi:hypothetical protein BGZ57DRAFT_928757 [Hyaloscypha finlandica]|nr:hypothetical protein BGZ57DRAFT_928757 [Hyaloscypha finlandica]
MLLQGDMNASLSEDIYNYETFLQPYNKSGTEYTLAGRNVDWIKSLFTSVGMPSVLSTTYDTYYLSCMQTDDLESDRDAWTNSNVAGTVSWPILVAGGGGVPPLLVLVCLLIWAVSCLVLGLVYGMQKRWAGTFDGYSFRRYCEGRQFDSSLIFEK